MLDTSPGFIGVQYVDYYVARKTKLLFLLLLYGIQAAKLMSSAVQ